jgi:hypothetical protein
LSSSGHHYPLLIHASDIRQLSVNTRAEFEIYNRGAMNVLGTPVKANNSAKFIPGKEADYEKLLRKIEFK